MSYGCKKLGAMCDAGSHSEHHYISHRDAGPQREFLARENSACFPHFLKLRSFGVMLMRATATVKKEVIQRITTVVW